MDPAQANQVWMTPPDGQDMHRCSAFWPVRERRSGRRPGQDVVERRAGPEAQPTKDLQDGRLGPHQARCAGVSYGVVCHARAHCRRFLDAPHPNQVWMIVPEPDEIWQCPAFWPVVERRRNSAGDTVAVERRKGPRPVDPVPPRAVDQEKS
jgi:hypothetical protein